MPRKIYSPFINVGSNMPANTTPLKTELYKWNLHIKCLYSYQGNNPLVRPVIAAHHYSQKACFETKQGHVLSPLSSVDTFSNMKNFNNPHLAIWTKPNKKNSAITMTKKTMQLQCEYSNTDFLRILSNKALGLHDHTGTAHFFPLGVPTATDLLSLPFHTELIPKSSYIYGYT